MKKLLVICSLFFGILLSSMSAFSTGPPGSSDDISILTKNTNFPEMTVAITPDYQLSPITMVMEVRMVENEIITERSTELYSQWRVSNSLILKCPMISCSYFSYIDTGPKYQEIYTLNRDLKIVAEIYIEGRLRPVSGGELTT